MYVGAVSIGTVVSILAIDLVRMQERTIIVGTVGIFARYYNSWVSVWMSVGAVFPAAFVSILAIDVVRM